MRTKRHPLQNIWTDIPAIQRAVTRNVLAIRRKNPLPFLERIIKASSNPNDIVLDAFCGCGTALVAAENLGRQWIGIDISPTACRVMAKRLRDVCHLREDETLWRNGRASWCATCRGREEQLRKIPPFEFENWAVIALGGIPNKAQVGDKGIDGRIYPVSAMPASPARDAGELDFMDEWYPGPGEAEGSGRAPGHRRLRNGHEPRQPKEGVFRFIRLQRRGAFRGATFLHGGT